MIKHNKIFFRTEKFLPGIYSKFPSTGNNSEEQDLDSETISLQPLCSLPEFCHETCSHRVKILHSSNFATTES